MYGSIRNSYAYTILARNLKARSHAADSDFSMKMHFNPIVREVGLDQDMVQMQVKSSQCYRKSFRNLDIIPLKF
jgi:hypothetical protein